ncbi:MAG TPA: hypothetical protein P5280_12805 [Cyclobacteriaceae bacterium]|nr:hypothetical protein [Cyclobacteriaceae bacterium]
MSASLFDYFSPGTPKGLDREESLKAVPVVNLGVKVLEERLCAHFQTTLDKATLKASA